MIATRVKEVLEAAIGQPPPAQFDLDEAIRVGRRRRRAHMSGTLVSAVATVAVVAAGLIGMVPGRWLPSAGSGAIASISSNPSAMPTGFGDTPGESVPGLWVHELPYSDFTPPADLAAVKLADPAPGFPFRVQEDGLYAITIGESAPCYVAQFAVSTAAPGTGGTAATVLVGNCAPPRRENGTIEGHRITANPDVAGVTGDFLRYEVDPAGGATETNSVLYFTTETFTVRILGTGLSQHQLVALGNALTGLR